jgi:hypothetical protein
MKCPQCQQENSAGTTFCISCGAGLIPGTRSKRRKAPEENPADTAAPQSSQTEAAAEAERIALLLRKKSAFPESTGTSRYITQPSVGIERVSQIEKQMSLLLGGLLIGAVLLGLLGVYLNLPEEEQPYRVSPLAGLIEQILNKPPQKADMQSLADQKIGAPMLYHVNTETSLAEVEATLAKAPASASPVGTTEEMQKQPPREKRQEKVQEQQAPEKPSQDDEEPIQMAKLETPSVQPPPLPEPVATPATSPANDAPPAARMHPNENKVAVVDRTIVAKKPLKRDSLGCAIDQDPQECSPGYVVTFKRVWGQVVEERIYPSGEMSRRALELWHREGKILEPNGKINETYVVKPKTFSPIPGHES